MIISGNDLVAREAFFTFFSGKKVTKNLVALKTRLFIRAFIWLPGMLARLFGFHVWFLSFVEPHGVLSLHETNLSRGSDRLARQSGADSRRFNSF